MKEEITVRVPEARVSEFYEMFGKWLAAGPCSPAEVIPEGQPKRSSPWTSEDVEKARTVYRQISPDARQLFGHLIDNPDRWFSALELARLLGVEDDDFRQVIAGRLSWPAKYCNEVGRPGFWEWQPSDSEEGGRYRIPRQNAELISKVRSQLGEEI